MSSTCTIPLASIGTLRDYVGIYWGESPKIMPESQISNVFMIPDVQYLHQCCGSGSESGSTGSTCFWASQIRILLSSCKNSKKNLDSYYFVTLFDFLSLKNDVNVASKRKKQKKLC
jgi:hypothetical protein